MSTMEDVLAGAEASRRAGWARYYAEKERADRLQACFDSSEREVGSLVWHDEQLRLLLGRLLERLGVQPLDAPAGALMHMNQAIEAATNLVADFDALRSAALDEVERLRRKLADAGIDPDA